MPRKYTPPKPCSVAGCDRLSVHLGMCNMHYVRFKRHGDPAVTLIAQPGGNCTVGGCNEKAHARGYCNKHYKHWLNSQANP